MTQYNNEHLYDSLSQLQHLQMSRSDVRDLWQSLCEHIAQNYENGICTDVQGFANFGFNSHGRPAATLKTEFFKSSASRYTTDQKIDSRIKLQPLTYSMLQGTRQQVSFLFNELQQKLLFHVSKMSISFGRLCTFVFDKRMRSYTFNFNKSIIYTMPQYLTVTQSSTNKLNQRASSAVSSQHSRASSVRSTNSQNNQTLQQTKQCIDQPKRCASAQVYQKQSTQKPNYNTNQYQFNTQKQRSVSVCSKNSEVANTQDFDDFYQRKNQTPLTCTQKHEPLYNKTLKTTQQIGYQTSKGYSDFDRKKIQQEYEDEKNKFLNKKQQFFEQRSAPRCSSVQQKLICQCRKCSYDQEIFQKTLKKTQKDIIEKTAYKEFVQREKQLYDDREANDRARYTTNQIANFDYNKAVAENKYKASLDFKRSGHYSLQGELQDNNAILCDDPNLKTTLRRRAELFLKHQQDQAYEIDLKRKNIDERMVDYVERQRLQQSIKQEKQQQLQFKRDQQKQLNREIAFYANQPKLIQPVVSAAMNCEQVFSGVFDNGYENETRFRNNHIETSRINELWAADNKKNVTLGRSQSVQLERSKNIQTLRDLEAERNVKMQKKKEVTNYYKNEYNSAIRSKTDQKARDRVNAWQNMDEYRFRDEVVPMTKCDICNRQYRYDNVFYVPEKQQILQ